MATIKEVTDIRVNGKSWRNCNGKKLNSLTVNDTTYKIVRENVNLIISGLNGSGEGSEYMPIPKGSNIRLDYYPGRQNITIYKNDVYFGEFLTSVLSTQTFMSLDRTEIKNIDADANVECKWGNKVGIIKVNEDVNDSSTDGFIDVQLSSYIQADYRGINLANLGITGSPSLTKSGNNLWEAQNVPQSTGLIINFQYYAEGEGYNSVFIDDELYTLTDAVEKSKTIKDTGERTFALTIVDNTWN